MCVVALHVSRLREGGGWRGDDREQRRGRGRQKETMPWNTHCSHCCEYVSWGRKIETTDQPGHAELQQSFSDISGSTITNLRILPSNSKSGWKAWYKARNRPT